MSESKIEWTGRSDWNPVRGCSRVSPGCGGPGPQGGCYAEAMAARFSKPGMWGHGFAEMVKGKPRWTGKVELQEDRLLMPLSWRKPAFVFPNSTSDFFHEALGVPAIAKLFAVMAMCPHLTFQIPTKRADRMRAVLSHPEFRNEVELAAERIKPSVGTPFSPKYSFAWPLPNVWLGVSAERQQEADERIPHLLQTPAAIRFVSAEPLLGPIDLTRWLDPISLHCIQGHETNHVLASEISYIQPPGENIVIAYCPKCGGDAVAGRGAHLDWIICGGESGPNARPMHPDWVRSLRDQCAAAGVAFFFKQWGEYHPSCVTGERVIDGHNFDDGVAMARLGKKTAGRLLDGIEHSAMPARAEG